MGRYLKGRSKGIIQMDLDKESKKKVATNIK